MQCTRAIYSGSVVAGREAVAQSVQLQGYGMIYPTSTREFYLLQNAQFVSGVRVARQTTEDSMAHAQCLLVS